METPPIEQPPPGNPNVESPHEEIETGNTQNSSVQQYFELSLKRIREVVPKERNFDLEIREDKEGVVMLLHHKESGETKNLRSFLPPSVSFHVGDQFAYAVRKRNVEFPINEIAFRGFLLSLFHEIGHAHEGQEHLASNFDLIKSTAQGLLKILRSISIKKETQQVDSDNKKTTFRLSSITADEAMPVWFISKFGHAQAKSERGAWAFALRGLRKLEREGYDVFSGFGSLAEIKQYIKVALLTYDISHDIKRYMAGDPDVLKSGRKTVFAKARMKFTETKKPE